MVRIRNKRTLVERNVPEQAVRYFPGYEVVRDTKPEEDKPHRSRKTAVESDTTEE